MDSSTSSVCTDEVQRRGDSEDTGVCVGGCVRILRRGPKNQWKVRKFDHEIFDEMKRREQTVQIQSDEQAYFNLWRVKLAFRIVGAYRDVQDERGRHLWTLGCRLYVVSEDVLAEVIEWGKPILPDLKFLFRRADVIPEDVLPDFQEWWSTLTPLSLSLISYEPVPRWGPCDDYSVYFTQRRFDLTRLDQSLRAVAEMRWLASGGLLSMDSDSNITEHNRVHHGASCIGPIPMLTRSESTLKEHGDAFKATTKLLLAVLEDWNIGLPHTLFFPQKLLPVLAEYAVSPDLQLVLSSKCRHLRERCHFRGGARVLWWTRRVGISPATNIRDILYTFLHVDDASFQLTATDEGGKLYDFSVLHSLPARTLPVSSCDREIRLQVQAKCVCVL